MAISFAKVRVDFDEAGWREIARSSDHRQELEDVADRSVVLPARARAPKLTGAGAAGIGREASLEPDGWEVHVSWSAATPYMRHQQFGTEDMPANEFLIPLEGPNV